MRVEIKREFLSHLLNKASTIGGEASTILDSFLFELCGDCLKIVRTNKILTAVVNTKLFVLKDNTEPYRFLIEAKKFYELIKELTCDTVVLEPTKDFFLKIQAGKFKGNWRGSNPNEFPVIPTLDKSSLIEVNASKFIKEVRSVEYATMKDGMRLEFRQAYFVDGMCWARDAVRCQKVLSDCAELPFKMILPVEGFDVIKFIQLSGVEKINIGETEKYYFFIVGEDLFLCMKANLIDIAFNELLRACDEKTQSYFYIEVGILRDVIKRIGLTSETQSRRIQFEVQKEELLIKSLDESSNESEERLTISLKGNQNVKKEFGLDWEYLVEALRVIGEKVVKFWINKTHIILDDDKGGIAIIPMKKGKHGE